MSEEARRLTTELVLHVPYGWRMAPGFVAAESALLSFIERIERELDGYYNEAAEGWGKFREAERRIAELEKACQQHERNATEAMALASQRGARLQILRDRITPPEWYNFVLRYPEAAGWFDEDGVPVGAVRKP